MKDKTYYEQYILNCLEKADEKQTRMIYIFASSYMKKADVQWPDIHLGDEEWKIIREIYFILRRNPNEKFLRKALTWIMSVEKVMYGYDFKKGVQAANVPSGQQE